MSLIQFPQNYVKLVTKYLTFLRNFRRNILRNFLGKTLKKFSGISWETNQEKFSGISRNLSNMGPISENFLRISEESVTRTCSPEISRKFPQRKSPKLETFCYLGTFTVLCYSSLNFFTKIVRVPKRSLKLFSEVNMFHYFGSPQIIFFFKMIV